MSGSSSTPPPRGDNALVAWLSRRFLEHLTVDEAWVSTVREAASRGDVVYVLRHQSVVDTLALDHLTKRHSLPPVGFTDDLADLLVQPAGAALRGLVAWRRRGPVAARLERALTAGESALLFLKRPPGMLEQPTGRARGLAEGDAALSALFELQRRRARPILLVPQVFVWSKRPDSQGGELLDPVFGAREWPGTVRTVLQFLSNYRGADLRAGEVVDLSEIVRETTASEQARVRRVTYTVLTRLERERRAILGPAKKNPDRMRDEILRSPKLQALIKDLAGEGRNERRLLTLKAYGMLRELEARPTLEVHKAFELALHQIVSRIYAGVEVDEEGLERVRRAGKRGTIVFLPSHKSHVDYLLLSYVLNAAHLQLPLIAAGDNLGFFPMGPIFRRGGAFFIRRSFKGDRLYVAVVDAYLRRVVKDGYALEFFLEGGRSRTGKLLAPKVGLLSMVVDAALSLAEREVTVLPVSIGYDRIVEERSYVREMQGGDKRKEDAGAMLRGARVLSGFYGRVNVQFGRELTLPRLRAELGYPGDKALTPAQRRGLVTRLAHQAMNEINRVTSVTPGAVVATVLLDGRRRGVPHAELVEACRRLVASLSSRGARMARSLVTSSGALRPDAIRDAAQLFVKGELVLAHVPGESLAGDARRRAAIYTGDDVVYTVADDKRLTLSLAKNIILHLFASRALVSTALLMPGEAAPTVETVRERVRMLSRLFKYELMFRADASFDAIFLETLADMERDGELSRDAADTFAFGGGHHGETGEGWVRFYAEVLRPFIEGYQVAARAAASLQKGPATAKDLVKRALVTGERMFLSGEIGRREAVARPLFETALEALVDHQYLAREDGKLALAPTFASGEAVTAIEARVRAFVV
ncbi:MAG: 1-acyl-sn-glycerol-3-phosphate acyltransferase [Polyangiaceae bacterium]|nr:1-acyl-sn-glycerol-3-phosphate acyltransferase [Polyangiaceae bacterium]